MISADVKANQNNKKDLVALRCTYLQQGRTSRSNLEMEPKYLTKSDI